MLETHPWADRVVTIGPAGLDHLLDHLLRLDAGERLRRFCHLADDRDLRAYVTHLDLANSKIIGCFEGGKMRGAAELRRTGLLRSRIIEATFSVEEDWQGRGIEWALVLRAIPVAREMGAREILIDRLGNSEHMRLIMAQFEMELLFGDDDCQAWLPVGAAYCFGSAQRSVP